MTLPILRLENGPIEPPQQQRDFPVAGSFATGRELRPVAEGHICPFTAALRLVTGDESLLFLLPIRFSGKRNRT